MRKRFINFAFSALIALAGCQAAGRLLVEILKERPPAPLESAEPTSDIRLDSLGTILGSMVGEGTSRQVHLLSTDTGLIATLARRYRPERARRGDIWEWLSRQGIFGVDARDLRDTPLGDQRVLVGSPDGHTPVRLRALYLKGSRCGWRGAQAEFVVEQTRDGEPSLRGPVVGSFRSPDRYDSDKRRYRDPPAEPSEALTEDLLARTEAAMDSALERRLSQRDRPLAPVGRGRIEINTLDDIDAADVIPFRLDDGRLRYAVSLRVRRITGGGDGAVAATVMVWDSAGAWQQVVFRPTLLDLRRGRLGSRSHQWPPVFWRRLEAVDGFAFDRDYVWMEQVNVDDGSVLWTIVEPRGITVVAAAEVEGPCS